MVSIAMAYRAMVLHLLSLNTLMWPNCVWSAI